MPGEEMILSALMGSGGGGGGGGGVAQIPAAFQAILGTWQYLNAIKQAKKNIQPPYKINPEPQQNLDMLKNTMGIPESVLDLYYRNAGQAGTAGINAITQTGGNGNMIANLVNNQQRNYQDVLGMDLLQKKQDIGGINIANLGVADERNKKFMFEYANWANKAAALSDQKGAGLQNIFGALNSYSGVKANEATSKLATPPPTSGVDLSSIMKSANGGFSDARQAQSYLNLGQNNMQYGLPDYSMFGNIFGQQQQSNFNPMDYSFLFRNNLFN